ncbi:organic solvent tolerance protein [Candidatus Pelagibacter bacterium nBUS_27]|uniref:LPS-assembly protein LptD n=1 Tax=Candidatus Pelagibacter bacterium nBUS_27 TaxID=3374188 RepID=UPI003EBF901C
MKNNFRYFLIYILASLTVVTAVKANDQFIFDITELEILDNGNQINGYKGGTATANNGIKIFANNFYYNKKTNILEVSGNVKFTDELNDLVITSDKAKYFKNEEKIFTYGNSKAVNKNNIITSSNFEYEKNNNIIKAIKNVKVVDLSKDAILKTDQLIYLKNEEKFITRGETYALIENKYNFYSKDVTYFRNELIISSQKKTLIEDDDKNIYELDNFNYSIDKNLLKGKNIKILSNNDPTSIDEYFFSEGFFNLKDKSFISKKTNVKLHKNIFDNSENDPRLYGSSSQGDQNQTIVNKGIFTSCKFNDNCPPWSIKSEKIVHDKIKKNLIYKNATLKIYDVPVMYFPKFFHPDPTVKRRSGFLQPQFNNSETLGSSIYVPYFKTLGPDKDLTFKPTIFEDNKYIFQNELRKKGKDYSLITDFALTTNYKSSSDNKSKNINHFFLNFKKNLLLPNFINSELDIDIQKVNNDTYLKVFANNLINTALMPSNKDLMESKVNLYLDNESYNFTSGFSSYEKLGVKNSDRYQFVFPYYDFYKNILTDKIDGFISISSNGNNILSNTNNLQTQITNNIEYNSIDYLTDNGFKNNFSIYLKNKNIVAKNDSVYTSSPQFDSMSLIKLDSIFPMKKDSKTKVESLTPKISFKINPGNNMNDFSQTNKIVDANNAFDANRLGLDAFEAGKSLTIGLDYKIDNKEISAKENDKDKYLEFNLATVIRDQNENNIPISSTINKKNSDIFGSINNHLLDNINFGYNFSLDNDMKTLNSNSINSEIKINNFVTTFNFIEERNEIGSTHSLSNSTEFKINDNNSLKFSTRRNKEINLTEYYDLSYEYKNDCLTAALKFNKVFYKDNDLKPSEDLFFSITLVPLTTYEKEIYKRN